MSTFKAITFSFCISLVVSNLSACLLVGIGMWFDNVPWRNWYLFSTIAMICQFIIITIGYGYLEDLIKKNHLAGGGGSKVEDTPVAGSEVG